MVQRFSERQAARDRARIIGVGHAPWRDERSETSATFLYHDLKVTTVNQHTSGSDGSTSTNSTTTVTHLLKTVGYAGHIDQFELLNGEWFENSHAAWGGEGEDQTYTYAANGNASSVAFNGDYSGGNGTRDVSWSNWDDSDSEGDSTGQSWATLTTYPPVGPPVTTGTASGGEEANGAESHNDTQGWEEDTKSTSPGYAYSATSASSNFNDGHNAYKDKVHWSETEAADGSVSTSGSASFHVSGSWSVGGQSRWAWTETTEATGSGSGSGSASTTSSNGGGAWSSGGSYSTSVNYWGFYEGDEDGAGAGSVYFGEGEGWSGPGSGSASGGGYLDTYTTVSEAEPGPPGGPVSGTNPGPSSEIAADAPTRAGAQPRPGITPAGLASAEENSEDEAQLLALADFNEGGSSGIPAELLADRLRALFAQAASSPEGAQSVLAQEEDFFNTYGDTPESRAIWDQLSATARQSIAAGEVEARQKARREGQQAARDHANEESRALNTDPPITKAEAEDAYERALLAKAAYSGSDAPDGWQIVEVFEDGAPSLPEDLKDVPAGFRAVLLEKVDAQGKGTGEYVLSFAGTDDLPDWGPNTGNAFGYLTSQYDYAVRLTQYVAAMYGRDKLSLVGHSLGGGLASTASVVHGIPATVFNPAGVNLYVARRHNIAADLKNLKAPITVYRVRTEPLTSWQDGNLWGPLSWAAPDTLGRVVTLFSELPFWKWPNRHGIDAVLGALKAAIEGPEEP